MSRWWMMGACAVFALTSPSAHGQAMCVADGVQESGSIYRICLPAGEYNGNLVIWCHGFQDATEPVGIPEEQMQFGDVYLPDLITDLGFGFATNSFSKTGLAVVQGMEDILDLVDLYTNEVGEPERIYLAGASEGGLIATLLLEQYPEIFDGGVAACGPIGDFRHQIQYLGDARATFEVYFPRVIPGDPFAPPRSLVESWETYYALRVKPVLLAAKNRGRLDEWLRVAKIPLDREGSLSSKELAARAVLSYAVLNSADATATLGGFPFDNASKWYTGARSNLLLNLLVPRATADPAAIAEMDARYDTTGQLERPLMTLHTTGDPQVPYFHESLYTLKNVINGDLGTKRLNLRVDRFEHCNFTADEALLMFSLLLVYDGNVQSILENLGNLVKIDEAGTIHFVP